ncbi:MAG: type IV pilin-like G/H family protein [Crocosphaera sp.]
MFYLEAKEASILGIFFVCLPIRVMLDPNLSKKPLGPRHPPGHGLTKICPDKLIIDILNILANTKDDRGFTLIELLVVILIIGILGAIALPQMMQMIGRGREVEARSMIGAMNRAQQAFFNENGNFANSAVQLDVPVGNEKYYTVFVNESNDLTVGGLQGAKGKDNDISGTRDHVGAVGYDPINRTFSTVVCRSIDQANRYIIAGLESTDATLGQGTVVGAIGGTDAACGDASIIETVQELK